MKINNNISTLSFKRAFSTKERENAEKAQEKAKKLLDLDRIILITPDTSLPAGKYDCGVGNLNAKESLDFYKFMKSYAGINNIKLLPQGELQNKKGFHCAYSGSGLTLGSHTINLAELTKREMGEILSKETLNKTISSAGESIYTNYENVVGNKSPHYRALEEAFLNFKNSNSPTINSLKAEYEKYKIKNKTTIENKALFEILAEENNSRKFRNWTNKIDKELFNEEIVSLQDREKRILELKTKHQEKIDFEYFKQFIADKNLEQAKAKLNKEGLKLYGDCLIGFSADEIWSNPKAFERKGNIASANWGISALNFYDITNEDSESFKILKQKVTKFAERYDGIRFDVGWAYTEPIIYTRHPEALENRYRFDNNINAFRLNDKLEGKLISKIENIVKEVKGTDFDTKNLIYEIEAGIDEFSVYDWNNNTVIPAFKNRTIVQSTAFLNENYATIDMLENRMHIPRDNYVLMVGNHDHLALESFAHGIDNDNLLSSTGNDIHKVLQKQYNALSNELKLDKNTIKNSPEEFTKAKFGQLFLAKNIKIFFADIYGLTEQFDSQSSNSAKNYRLRIPAEYEKAYHKTLQANKGFNIYDAMAKAMKGKGLDKDNKKLYKEIVKYSKILYKKGALTEAEANTKIKKNITKKYTLLALAIASGLGLTTFLLKKFKEK